MSTVLHPVGPRPERVYWIRRLVLLAVVVVLAVVVWALLRPTGGDADGGAAADDVEGQTDTVADGAAADGGDQAADGPDEAAGGPAACAAAELALTLASDARSYPAGAQPVFTVAITNTGASACTVDAGEAAREILITSGTDRIWSSLDCPSGGGERLLLLEPGARDETQVAWSRVRSAEGCPADLPEPRPGTYSAVVNLSGASSAAAVLDLG